MPLSEEHKEPEVSSSEHAPAQVVNKSGWQSLRAATYHWLETIRDQCKRRAMMMTGKHFFRAGRKVELAGISFDWLWNKDLVRAIKKLGEALVFFCRTQVCL